MKLYIAGPMRGIPEFNFPAFHKAEQALVEAGFGTFNPARKDEEAGFDSSDLKGTEEHPLGSGFNIREVLAIDVEWICREADGIATLPGAGNSKGAMAEVALARALGLPVKTVDTWVRGAEPTDIPVEDLRTEPERVSLPTTEPISSYQTLIIGKAHDLPRYTAPGVVQQGNEVRVTSSTGGQKGSKLARFDLIPSAQLKELAEHYGKGSQKYDDDNWKKGYDWSLSFAAMMRHAWDFWNGQDIDPETGTKEVIAVAWHAIALAWFMDHRREFDNRRA